MYGKAVKSRHCPATVCAFATAPPSRNRWEPVVPECHELPTGFSESGKGTGRRRRRYLLARESGDRSQCAWYEPRSEGNEGEPDACTHTPRLAPILFCISADGCCPFACLC